MWEEVGWFLAPKFTWVVTVSNFLDLFSSTITAKGSFWSRKVRLGRATSFGVSCLHLLAEAARRESKRITRAPAPLAASRRALHTLPTDASTVMNRPTPTSFPGGVLLRMRTLQADCLGSNPSSATYWLKRSLSQACQGPGWWCLAFHKHSNVAYYLRPITPNSP